MMDNDLYLDTLRIGFTKLGLDHRDNAAVIMRTTHGTLETLLKNIEKQLEASGGARV